MISEDIFNEKYKEALLFLDNKIDLLTIEIKRLKNDRTKLAKEIFNCK